jgi:transcription elongation factor GreA
MTAAKFEELKSKVHRWKTINRPREAAEVARLALMGDFSENVGYQVAKGRLRGLNQRIIDTENLLARAEIITPSGDTETVRLGSRVTIAKIDPNKTTSRDNDASQDDNTNRQKTYQILGSAETAPATGVISHSSPLGAALLSRRVGEIIKVEINGKTVEYRIVEIN